MKIAVYGISCAGKDTFISQFIERFSGYKHIKGSAKLNEIASRKYHCSFKETDKNTQALIRKALIEELHEIDDIVVDGHYCFPDSNFYEIVFTDLDRDLYDIFIYLKVPPTDILARIKNSKKNFEYTSLTEVDIKKWQQKEICDLRNICFKEYKEFIILDNDFEKNFSFLDLYFSCYPKMKAVEISTEIVKKVMTECGDNKKVAFFDCDRTIIREDVTIPFFESNNKSPHVLKNIFNDDVYSSYQFWRQQELYKKFTKYPCISNFNFNEPVINKLEQLRKNRFIIYGFTAGVHKIWREINRTYHLFHDVIGNNYLHGSYGVITDFIKGFVVRILKENGYEIFSTGDSMCDIYMLEYSGGYIWAPGKIRVTVQNYIDTHCETSIKQYKDNPYHYKGIKEVL